MRKGFTLIELIVVLVVLTVGLMTLLLAMRVANVQNATSHFIAVADRLASGKMELIFWVRDDANFNVVRNENFPPEDPVSGFSNYKREVDIFYVELSDLNTSAGTDTGYKRVKVTVSSKVGIAPDIEIVTIISDGAPSG